MVRMSSIDCRRLVEKLRGAEGEQAFTPPEVSPYVLRHIYEPLLRGEEVLFADLDFTAFDEDDLRGLAGYIDASVRSTSALITLNGVFCRKEPASLTRRAFC